MSIISYHGFCPQYLEPSQAGWQFPTQVTVADFACQALITLLLEPRCPLPMLGEEDAQALRNDARLAEKAGKLTANAPIVWGKQMISNDVLPMGRVKAGKTSWTGNWCFIGICGACCFLVLLQPNWSYRSIVQWKSFCPVCPWPMSLKPWTAADMKEEHCGTSWLKRMGSQYCNYIFGWLRMETSIGWLLDHTYRYT